MATININENENIKVNLNAQESTLNASLNNINYIPSYKEAEEERRANELIRISNEDERIAYYEEIQQKVANGEFKGEKGDKGDPGSGAGINDVTVNGTTTVTNNVAELTIPTNLINGSAYGSLRGVNAAQENESTYLMGENAFAMGTNAKASGNSAHATGSITEASGNSAHAEGNYTKAKATAAHAEGSRTTANSTGSHTEGFGTIASSNYQHVQGKYNIEDADNQYAHILGNGSSKNRSNAHTVDWEGNAWYQGAVKVGGTSYDDADELATKKYVDDNAGSGSGNVVVDDESEITDDTLIYIDSDAKPDKIPEWYNGTLVTQEGKTIVDGSATGDYYINTDTFNVYYATAENTWELVGNIKGKNGSTGIFFGAYDGSDGEPPEDATLWIDPNETASTEFLPTDGLFSALTGINQQIEYYYDTTTNGSSSSIRLIRLGNILLQMGFNAFSGTTSVKTSTIYFSSALGQYADAPTIVHSDSSATPQYVHTAIGGATTSQFTAYYIKTNSNGTINFRWFAIGTVTE